MREISYADWWSEGVTKFGGNFMEWRFVCPACGHVARVLDWQAANAPEAAAAFSCVGRWLQNPRDAFVKGNGPCNYAGGGLFALNPVKVVFPDGVTRNAFEFYDSEDVS
jgi:hypothetical protein